MATLSQCNVMIQYVCDVNALLSDVANLSRETENYRYLTVSSSEVVTVKYIGSLWLRTDKRTIPTITADCGDCSREITRDVITRYAKSELVMGWVHPWVGLGWVGWRLNCVIFLTSRNTLLSVNEYCSWIITFIDSWLVECRVNKLIIG